MNKRDIKDDLVIRPVHRDDGQLIDIIINGAGRWADAYFMTRLTRDKAPEARNNCT